jgi:aspartate racemase
MKTIGLIGGMSWESSAQYYRIINETVKQELGGLRSAKIVMYSFDFEEIEKLQHEGRWDETAGLLIDAARRLKKAGADFFVICTNTMHIVADKVQNASAIPLLHIADATAEQIKNAPLKRIGLLGTKFTMEKDFYKGRLTEKHGLEVVIPDTDERQTIHDIIYRELCLGQIKQRSRERFKSIIESLVQNGAEGIILGCTEIGLLLEQKDTQVPLFDTTVIHAKSAARLAMEHQLT